MPGSFPAGQGLGVAGSSAAAADDLEFRGKAELAAGQLTEDFAGDAQQGVRAPVGQVLVEFGVTEEAAKRVYGAESGPACPDRSVEAGCLRYLALRGCLVRSVPLGGIVGGCLRCYDRVESRGI
jgi:hypothetical protein